MDAETPPGLRIRRVDEEDWHEVRCPAGTEIRLEQGAVFGPLVAGSGGALLYEVFLGDPGSWAADPEGFGRLLAEGGVEMLRNPPIDFPPA